MTACCQVTTAVDEESLAEELAAAIVAERLAACAQILGPVRSVYRWEGDVRHTREWLVVAKTTIARLPQLTARIRALHRYEVPEIVSVAIASGDRDYLGWIRRETTPTTKESR